MANDDDAQRNRFELDKLRWDISPWTRALGLAIPLLGAYIAYAQYGMSIRD